MATTKKKADAAAPMPTLQVRAIDPIRADGVDYAPGELFDIDEASAAALVAGGWAELVPAAEAT
jgi:hypothetical protein